MMVADGTGVGDSGSQISFQNNLRESIYSNLKQNEHQQSAKSSKITLGGRQNLLSSDCMQKEKNLPQTIMLVDDNVMNIVVIQRLLEKLPSVAKVHIVTAQDG